MAKYARLTFALLIMLLAARVVSASVIISASEIHTAKGETGKFAIIDFKLKASVSSKQTPPAGTLKVFVLVNGKALDPTPPLTWTDVNSGLLVNTDLDPANGPPLFPPSTVQLKLDSPDSRTSNVLRTVVGDQAGEISLDPTGRPTPGGAQSFHVVNGSNTTPLPADVFGAGSFTASFVPTLGSLDVTYESTPDPDQLKIFLNSGELFLQDPIFGTSTVTFDSGIPIGSLTYTGPNSGIVDGQLSGKVTNSVLRDDLFGGIGPEFFSVSFSGNFTVLQNAEGEERTVVDFVYGGPELGSAVMFSLQSVTEPSILAIFGLGIAGLELMRRKRAA